MINQPLFSHLKKNSNLTIAIISALALFGFNYYLMASLPGERNMACVMGAALTPINIAFSTALSLLVGLTLSGLFSLLQQKRLQVKSATSASGLGLILGSLTMFCTFCTLPVISLFGLSIGIGFITFYTSYFQAASILAMLYSCFLLNRQLKGECQVCKVTQTASSSS